jgi:hypothetical protein
VGHPVHGGAPGDRRARHPREPTQTAAPQIRSFGHEHRDFLQSRAGISASRSVG